MRLSTWRDELRVEFGFSFLDSSVFRNIDAMDLKIYIALCRCVWRSQQRGSQELRELAHRLVIAKIGQDTLAGRVGVSLATVKRSLERLREIKWIESLPGHGREIYYVLGSVEDGREDFFVASITRRVVDIEAEAGEIPAAEPADTGPEQDLSQLTPAPSDSSPVSDQVAHGRPTEVVKRKEEKEADSDSLRSSGSSGTSEHPPTPSGSALGSGGDGEVPRVPSDSLSDGSLPPGTPPGVAKAIAAIRANNDRTVTETNRRPKVVTPPSGKGRVAVAETERQVDAAVAAYQVAYAKAFGGEQTLGKSGRAQIRSLVKDYGLDTAKNMLVFVVEKWNTLAPRWRATGFPEPRIVLFRAKSLGTEMTSGAHGVWKPVPSRDEREARAQESRQRMYDDKDPSKKKSGWEGWMNAGKSAGA